MWEAVRDICGRYSLDFQALKDELLEMRDNSEELSRADVKLCNENLLAYYHRRAADDIAGTRYLHVEAFAQIVFVLPFETVLIESLFSVMGYNKDKTRSSLLDDKVGTSSPLWGAPPLVCTSLSLSLLVNAACYSPYSV